MESKGRCKNKKAEISVKRKSDVEVLVRWTERRKWWCRSENSASFAMIYENEGRELRKLEHNSITEQLKSTQEKMRGKPRGEQVKERLH